MNLYKLKHAIEFEIWNPKNKYVDQIFPYTNPEFNIVTEAIYIYPFLKKSYYIYFDWDNKITKFNPFFKCYRNLFLHEPIF